jgi:YbgC/YbaW family acyl-CoA thioester hydrolase
MPCRQPFLFPTRIRFIDTDASGRIHYTCLFRYFESAEIEFMRTLDISYIGGNIALPRVHVECDYRLAILYDDLLEIEVCLTKLGRSSIGLEFRAMKQGELAAKGFIVLACMDRKTQLSVPLPDELRAKLSSVLDE